MSSISPSNQSRLLQNQSMPVANNQENAFIRRTSGVAANVFSTLTVSEQSTHLHFDFNEKAQFSRDLNTWAEKEIRLNPENKGDIETAKQRIFQCYQSKKSFLDLSNLDLSSLPDCFQELTHLEDLNLFNNNLTSFDGTKLTNLTSLCLADNRLTSFDEAELTKLTGLNLNNNQLTSFNGTELTKLEALYLTKNNLTSFNGTGLTNLKHLDLSTNSLSSFNGTGLTSLRDLSLGHNQIISFNGTGLTNLIELSLYENQLTSFDGTGLTNLTVLNLCFNHLRSFDGTGLTNLTVLYLIKNNLTSLSGMELSNLKEISIKNNPNITELPMTLGRCPELTYLSAAGSGIPPSIIQAILASCQALRSQAAASNLIPKIELWLRYSGVKDSELESNCNVIVEKLDSEQKVIIYEWLTRLERAADFKNNQKDLATIICSILKDLNNEEFRQLALTQMKANNECCQDRAAMALNELYLSWQIYCNSQVLSDNDNLNLIIGAGKTLALRNAIGEQLKEKEIGQGESVEIYLYLESTLAEELGLLTCIKEMSYRIFAQTQIKEISIGDLKTFVEEHYLEQAADLPILDTLIAGDPNPKTKNDIGLITSRSQLLLTQLGDLPERQTEEKEEVFQDRYLQWASKAGEIKTLRDSAILQVKIKYLKNQLRIV